MCLILLMLPAWWQPPSTKMDRQKERVEEEEEHIDISLNSSQGCQLFSKLLGRADLRVRAFSGGHYNSLAANLLAAQPSSLVPMFAIVVVVVLLLILLCYAILKTGKAYVLFPFP